MGEALFRWMCAERGEYLKRTARGADILPSGSRQSGFLRPGPIAPSSMFPLVLLIPLAFLLQCHLDIRHIGSTAEGYRWSVSRVTWAPFADYFSNPRGGRCYWLSYRDANGRTARRMCRVSGAPGFTASVAFDPPSFESA
jgi:hypothetical protein